MEGETFTDDKVNASSSNHVPFYFDSAVVKLASRSDADWKISGTKLADNKFNIVIDITANGMTIGKETMTENIIRPSIFPSDFPACELKFYFNSDYSRSKMPYFKDMIKNTRYLMDSYYVYVVQPIDLSGTETIDNGDWTITIKHYEFNFSESGWYRIIQSYNGFKNVSKDLLEKNNYFYFAK